jgi:polyphosphate kinase
MMVDRMAATRVKRRNVSAADRLISRELSFLDYDARVLALAEDPDLPLLERVRFCSIFSEMLDEFFMVRVAGLIGQASAGLTVRSPDGRTPQQALAEARELVLGLYATQSRVWSQELCPALAAEGIVVSRVEDLSALELEQLERRYQLDVYPVLTPLAVGPGQPFPYISPLSISLAVFARDPETGEERFARVKVPEGLPRFIAVGDAGRLVPVEQVLSHFLPSLFPTSTSPTRRTTCSRRSSCSCASGASARWCVSRSRARCRVRCASASSSGCA